ncbi:hypothetical protein VTH06DRAFT_3967 [Thermothelomyces fergusii]
MDNCRSIAWPSFKPASRAFTRPGLLRFARPISTVNRQQTPILLRSSKHARDELKIPIHLGQPVNEYSEDDNQAGSVLKSGERVVADLVIGADQAGTRTCRAVVEKTPSLADWKLVYCGPLSAWVSKHAKILILGDPEHQLSPTSAQGVAIDVCPRRAREELTCRPPSACTRRLWKQHRWPR